MSEYNPPCTVVEPEFTLDMYKWLYPHDRKIVCDLVENGATWRTLTLDNDLGCSMFSGIIMTTSFYLHGGEYVVQMMDEPEDIIFTDPPCFDLIDEFEGSFKAQ